MKQFEKWYNQFNNALMSKTEKKMQERAWKAAVAWVLADLKAAREGFDLGLYDTLKKELGETEK